MHMAASMETDRSNGAGEPPKAETVRKNFQDSWLWDSLFIDSNGEAVVSTKAPDTITTWLATMFGVHPKYGLFVAAKPAELTTFLEMFVSLGVPSFITRYEDYCFLASVFNYRNDSLVVAVTLKANDMFSNIYAKLDGQQVSLSRESVYYTYVFGDVEQNGMATCKFCITPLVIGEVPVHVMVRTNVKDLSDAVEQNMTVKAEGLPRTTTQSVLIEMSSGFWTENVNITFPQETVNGSQSLVVRVAGNFMGPMLANLQDLLKQPYGCGEQNMLNLAPDIYAMEFYKETNTGTPELIQQLQEFIMSGYQTQLTYEHTTGGFSAFGNSDKTASTWLTAFVVRCFCQAWTVIEKYSLSLVIDAKVISRNVDFLLTKQNPNGSFREDGLVFHNDMQGGSAEGEALTAFTGIALFEASKVLRNNSTEYLKIQESIASSGDFVARRLPHMTDPYDLIIIAYFLHLIDHPDKSQSFDKVESIAQTEDGFKYWERKKTSSENLDRYAWSASTDSISTEMTSYVLMIYDLLDQKTNLPLPVIRWLCSQKGPNGGFVSTQDTVVGLDALTKTAAKMYTTEDTPITITISYITSTGEKSETFDINKENELLLQTMYISGDNLPNSLNITAKTKNGQRGSSTSILEVTQYYNVEQSFKPQVFNMSHVLTKKDNGDLELKITSRSLLPGQMDMTILEVEIPSTYIVDTENLKTQEGVSLADVEDSVLNIYFNTNAITKEGRTVTIIMIHNGITLKFQPKNYMIYRYYNPDEQYVKAYNIDSEDYCTSRPEDGACYSASSAKRK